MSCGSYVQVHVLCPFYRFDDGAKKIIGCEPITDGELPTKRMFRTKESMDMILRGYCCKDYRYCEYYRMLMEYKYSE